MAMALLHVAAAAAMELAKSLEPLWAALGRARLGALAAVGAPAWEASACASLGGLALVAGVALLLGLLLVLEVNPLRSFIGDRPVLVHHPASPVAALLAARVAIFRFWPTPWLCSPHLQTMFLHFFARAPAVAYRRQLVTTPDGGTLALDWVLGAPGAELPVSSDGGTARATGQTTEEVEGMAEPPVPIALLVPGLSSDSQSQYVKHCAADLAKLKWRVLVLNHRGLGGVQITSRKLYNAGWTEDLQFVLGLLKAAEPDVPIYACGFSMGGNILAKFLGEAGGQSLIQAAVVVGCPWDLLVCDRWMNRRLVQRMYNSALAFSLKVFAFRHKEALSKLVSVHHLTKERDDSSVLAHAGGKEMTRWAMAGQESRSIRQFDNYVTRVIANYETVDTYYRRSSSSQFLPGVAVPLLCVAALDDPICTQEALPWAESRHNPNVVLLVTKHGGHLSYLQGLTAASIWWSDLARRFLHAVSEADPDALGTRAEHLHGGPAAAWDGLQEPLPQPKKGIPGACQVVGEALPPPAALTQSAACQGVGSADAKECPDGEAGDCQGVSRRGSQQEWQPAIASGQAGPSCAARSDMAALALVDSSDPRGSNPLAASLFQRHLLPSAAPPSSVPVVLFLPGPPGGDSISATSLLHLESLLKQLLQAVQTLQHPQHQTASSSDAALPSSLLTDGGVRQKPEGKGAQGSEWNGCDVHATRSEGLPLSAQGRTHQARDAGLCGAPAFCFQSVSRAEGSEVKTGPIINHGQAPVLSGTFAKMLADFQQSERASRRKQDNILLLMHAAISLAGPVAALAIALRLKRIYA